MAQARRMVPEAPPPRTSFTRGEAAAFFAELAAAPIGFGYPDSDCEVRADISAAMAERAGVTARKVLVYSDGETPLRATTPNTASGEVGWLGWHIALAVEVEGRLRVFDPALFDRPVSVRTWQKRMGEAGERARVRVLPGNQYMPEYSPMPRDVRVRQLAHSLARATQLHQYELDRRAELDAMRATDGD